MSNPVIDFIITHATEPFGVGKPFFDMLAMQKNVDFSSFRVILVQDGSYEDEPDWHSLLSSYPYKIVIMRPARGGPAHARNVGLRQSTAEWVMFFDFDDLFSDVVSLCSLMNVLPAKEADLIWMHTYWQKYSRAPQGMEIVINCVREDFYHTHGKLYRRSVLTKHNITFNRNLQYDYQSAFNHIFLSSVPSDRVHTLRVDFIPYMKTLRNSSLHINRETVSAQITDMFDRDIFLTEEYVRRKYSRDYVCMVTETLIDAYFLCNSKPTISNIADIRNKAVAFYHRHKKTFHSIRQSELEIVHGNCVGKMYSVVQNLYNNYDIEVFTPPETINAINAWIVSLDKLTPEPEPETDTPPAVQTTQAPVTASAHHGDRIVVYCGTSNTYQNMLTSAKSVLAHTPVDAIYFLIEDDTFPAELPPVIHTINIKPLALNTFPSSGPNFNNAWSYMCMARALFPPLFKAYDRILSLDIDVIINEDISSLWDIDLTNHYFAGVPEPQRRKKPSDPLYCNFGVILMNIPLMNADRIGDKVISLLNESKLGCPEQDAFNRICAGRILPLPPDYNYTPFSHITAEPEREIITHYAGIKYWKHFDSFRKYSDIPFSDLQITKESEHHAEE